MMNQDVVIQILEAADITSEQARKILDYCYDKIELIDGQTWYRLPLPRKLEQWLKKKAKEVIE